MSDQNEKRPDNGEEQPPIESPIDGPTPDWMRSATSSRGSSFQESDAPDWLKNIRAGKTPPTPDEPAAEDDDMSDLARLLADEGIDLDDLDDERPQGSEGMSVKDWMIATSDDELIRKRVGAEVMPPQPEPEAPPPAPTVSLDADKMIVTDDLPDWLREISEDEPASEPVEAPASTDQFAGEMMVADDDLPAWLREVSDEPEIPAAASGLILGDDDLPGWLQEVSDEAESTLPAATEEPDDDAYLGSDEDLPDWLRETPETGEAVDLEPAGVPEALSAQPDTADMPAWLRGVVEEEAGEDMLIEEISAGTDIPDWLQQVTDEVAGEPLTATGDDPLGVGTELPDWLREVEEGSAPLAAAPVEPEAAQIQPAETPVDDNELPGWLRDVEMDTAEDKLFTPEPDTVSRLQPVSGVADEAAIDDDNLPDWLRDSSDDEEPDDDDEVFPDKFDVDDEALPDWLKQVQAAEQEGQLSALMEPETAPPPAEAEAKHEEDELPDWLKEVEAEAETLVISFEEKTVLPDSGLVEALPEPETMADLPDWLQEIEAGEEEVFEPSEPSPEEFFARIVPEEPAVEEEELPDWLQEVQPEEAELPVAQAPAEPEPVAEVSAESVDAEIIEEEELPDWLREFAAEPEPVFEEVALLDIAEPAAVEPAVAEPEPEVDLFEPEEVSPVEMPEPVAAAMAEPEPQPVIEAEPAPVAQTATPRLRELPDWLTKLREGDVDEEDLTVPTPVAPAPAVAKVQPALQSQAEAAPVIPEDAQERLKLARKARESGEIAEAVTFYDSLVSSGALLENVIEDLRQSVKTHPGQPMLYQVMGDAMMKDGRLQSALEAYRQALAIL
jgi:hypothetical protein